MTSKEKELFEAAEAEYPGMNLFWLPSLWFAHNLRAAQEQGKISFFDGARLIMQVIMSHLYESPSLKKNGSTI